MIPCRGVFPFSYNIWGSEIFVVQFGENRVKNSICWCICDGISANPSAFYFNTVIWRLWDPLVVNSHILVSSTNVIYSIEEQHNMSSKYEIYRLSALLQNSSLKPVGMTNLQTYKIRHVQIIQVLLCFSNKLQTRWEPMSLWVDNMQPKHTDISREWQMCGFQTWTYGAEQIIYKIRQYLF